jgi:hypothetical protein
MVLPVLRSDQAKIATHPAKIKVLSMGRRWGKSVLGGVLTMNVLRQHGRVAWIVPSYKNGRSLWRWAQSVAGPMKRQFDISKAERTISTHRGGFFGIYSADNADAIRGEWFHLVVLDEAARIAEEDWTDAIQPTLADADGDAILISTPKGRNWFWQEWQRGRSGDPNQIKSWRAPTDRNPSERIQKAARLAAERVPRATYEQEWLARFVEDGLTLFRVADVDRAARDIPERTGGPYVTTVDIGRRRDATVINTFDVSAEPYVRVAFDRLERVPYPAIQTAIENRARAFPGALWVESNGVGDPVIENLTVPCQPFVTTARSKVQAIQALQLLFERDRIKARWDARERAALIAAAWDDEHTADEIMSLAIFASAAGKPSAQSLLSYYQRRLAQQKEAAHA